MMQASLDRFHENKVIFVDLGIREHFNIPKIHSMQHYIEMIRSRGTADGFNTELPERLHIDVAKKAYRASNKKDFFKQMTKWLARQESIYLFQKFLTWKSGPIAAVEQPDVNEETDDRDMQDGPGEISNLSNRLPVPATIGVHEPAITPTLPFLSGPDETPSPYALAAVPAFPHMSLKDIVRKHKAPSFVDALSVYLRKNNPSFRRQIDLHDVLPVYKQFKLLLKPVLHVSNSKRLNHVRAIPEQPKRPGYPGIPE